MSRRYTPSILAALGYKHNFAHLQGQQSSPIEPEPGNDLRIIAVNQFENIIKTIFSNDDGEIPNLLKVVITDNTPESVKEFVRNVLSTNISAFKAAPDSDTAFDMIFPRRAYSSVGYRQWSDSIKNVISYYQSEYRAKHSSNSEPPKTE